MKLVFVDLVGAGVQDGVNRYTEEQIQTVKNLAKKDKIIFYCLNERWDTRFINNSLKVFFDSFENENLLLICDRLSTQEDLQKIAIKKVVQTDSQLLKTAQWETYISFNNEVNLDTGRFLFLMGKPYKPNRLPLLYLLKQKKLLDKCDYSFYYDNRFADKTRDIMNFIDDKEYNSFIKSTCKKLDPITFEIEYDFFDYCGFPIDHTLYKNTSLSVVSESVYDIDNSHFISEKTWRTIANKHMFLPVLPNKSIDFLNTLGIRTFDYCLYHQKESMQYTYHDDIRDLLDKVVENVEHVLANISKHKEKINEDIQHNYRVYRYLIKLQRKKVARCIEKYLNIYPIEQGHEQIRIMNMDLKLQIATEKLYNLDRI